MLGQTIGRYRILAKIGEGGMGSVWKAQHTLLPDRIVALKLPSGDPWSPTETRDRVLREAVTVSKLDHPRIATLFDAEMIDGHFYIAFKYIEGETIGHKTRAGPLPLDEAVGIAADAADALAHAHSRGVLHRDVTAGNLMIDREGRGVLVDFGLALPSPDAHLTRTGSAQGTLPYMAPETLKGRAADQRTDLYGLGVVLFQMLTGRQPFESPPDQGLIYEILNTRPRPPSELRPGVPPKLDDLVLRLLEKHPEERYATANAVMADLRRLMGHPAIRSDDTRPIPHPGRPWWQWAYGLRRRIRTRVARRAAAVAAAALALAAWMLGPWRPGVRERTPIVAVLPVRNASPDSAESAYLSELFGEGLVAQLTGVKGIRVLPWLTTARFDPGAMPLPRVARELGADQLLIGSFTSDGERIRATMNLVNAKGVQRWARTFDERIDAIPTLQEAITRGAIQELAGAASAAAHVVSPRNAEAYEYFLRGANRLHSPEPIEQAEAELYFQKAVDLDPNLAEAYVGLGAVHTDRFFRGDVGGRRNLDVAEAHFRRALRINPRLGAAERGLIRVYFERGPSEEILKLASGAARRSSVDDVDDLMTAAWGYTLGGLPNESLPFYERILKLDPANPAATWYQVVALCWAGRMEEALEGGKAYIRRFGEDPEIYLWMAVSSHVLNRRGDARLYYERSVNLFGDNVTYAASYLAAFYRQEGLSGAKVRTLCVQAAASLERRLAASPDNVRLQSDLAGLYAAMGDSARFREHLRITAATDADPFWYSSDAVYIPLHLAQAGDLEGALEILSAIRSDPAWWITKYGYGFLTHVLAGGRTEELLNHPRWKALVMSQEAEMARRLELYAPTSNSSKP